VTFTLPLRAPLLVFGGPYSNIRALTALRARAAELGIDASHTICTGDTVAYCAEPEETVAAIREWGCHVVAGNCEEQLALDAEDCGCGFADDSPCDRLAKGWYAFARWRISAQSRAWMASLPKSLTLAIAGRTVRMIHGGVDRINRFVFASQRGLIADELDKANVDIVIAGHAGIPFIRNVRQRIWFNPGVIGMPANDGTPDVWYGLIRTDGDDLILSTHRLAYDHLGAAAALRASGHADGYARSLITGLWPSIDVLPRRERAASGKRMKEQTTRSPMRTLEQIAAVDGRQTLNARVARA
jgi:predicted phosphodiesterase